MAYDESPHEKRKNRMLIVAELDETVIDEDLPPSKSQLKREAEAQTDLGKKLLEMKPSERKMLPLSGELLKALEESDRIHHHVAKKRQMKLLGKILRAMDSSAVAAVVNHLEKDELARTKHFHMIEKWRDRLINDGDIAIQQFIDEYPLASRQQLREWVRQANRDLAQEKPSRAARLIFKYIRETISNQ
ncbi:MAG: DUF615 domain-containing protein [Zetaproteobacteria bacterium]|nr:DUF615 domain-containing protein [Zetaproteobacteria bacterium]